MATRFVNIDRDTLGTFRRENKARLSECFVKVPELAPTLATIPAEAGRTHGDGEAKTRSGAARSAK